jgi:hypothetical protein
LNNAREDVAQIEFGRIVEKVLEYRLDIQEEVLDTSV